VETFTIITGEPNELVASIHNRMAVILPSEHYQQWLDPKFQDTDLLTQLLAAYSADQMKAHPVSTMVNNPKFEDARCIEALGGLKPEGAEAY
jgi:putative SOS response-associated peptidase YedK